MERDLSYGELCALDCEFEKQCEYAGIEWFDDDVKNECFRDFCLQYQEGNDNPQIYIEGAPAGSYGIYLPF